jgi:hypothetical protein
LHDEGATDHEDTSPRRDRARAGDRVWGVECVVGAIATVEVVSDESQAAIDNRVSISQG